MKRFVLSHLGTILVVLLLGAVAWVALANLEYTKTVFKNAWSNSVTNHASPPDAPQTATLLQKIEWKRLLSDVTPGQWFLVLAAIFLGFLAGKIVATIVGRAGRALDVRGLKSRAHVMTSLVGPVSLALFTFGLSVGGSNSRVA